MPQLTFDEVRDIAREAIDTIATRPYVTVGEIWNVLEPALADPYDTYMLTVEFIAALARSGYMPPAVRAGGVTADMFRHLLQAEADGDMDMAAYVWHEADAAGLAAPLLRLALIAASQADIARRAVHQ